MREQHESKLTDTELQFLDELTLVNSHFVTLCDYYGNVRLESMTRAPPWLYKMHLKWEKAIAALCFQRLPCCVKRALELGLIALLIWSACALERLVKVKCKHHLNHHISHLFLSSSMRFQSILDCFLLIVYVHRGRDGTYSSVHRWLLCKRSNK